MRAFAEEALYRCFGMRIKAMWEVPGGWSAHALVADTDAGQYFVKVYDKHRPTVQSWIARMWENMPVVLWLRDNTPLGERMAAPLLTQSGDYKVENADFLALVFPYIEGETLGDAPLTLEQIRQLAQLLAALHGSGLRAGVPVKGISETYVVPFLADIEAYLCARDLPEDVRQTLVPHASILMAAVSRLSQGAEGMRLERPACTLCHTDVHGWNLMWDGEALHLIDWEGLMFAPAEADLFAFSDGFFFDYAREEFFQTYAALRPDFVLNPQAMDFYRLRRRMEDIYEFLRGILADGLSESERQKSLAHLQRECEALKKKKKRG